MEISGKMLRDALISAANNIANNKKMVDELNVFPVPDGDTGTNMSMTINNAVPELKLLADNTAVSVVANTAASAMLRGARGNSGVILSLLFRGLSKGLSGKNTANSKDLSDAFTLGVDAAYKAVMKPTEGTILTVARVACENVSKLISNEEIDVVKFWDEYLYHARQTLDMTPELLPVLKKSGVVDAGGKGYVVILEGMQSVIENEVIIKRTETRKQEPVITNAAGSFVGDITFTYCTEFIVCKSKNSKDAMALRAFLESIGDSVVVVDDDEIIKVHVHTNNPGKALEEGLLFGSLTKLKIENMREQHENQIKEVERIKEQAPVYAPKEKPYGFVTVAAGQGLEDLFKDLGADSIVRGGQTMNPSTEDILAAIQATPAETVFVLPNNKNIIMAAEQAVKLADRRVCVLQTRTIPQGIAALMAFNAEDDFNFNRLNMTKAFDKISTGQITFAARDSDFDGHTIQKGEILAMDNGKLSFVEKDVTKALAKLIKRMSKQKVSYITIFYGSDVSDDTAQEAYENVKSKMPADVEISMINGGQPVYYYIVSIE